MGTWTITGKGGYTLHCRGNGRLFIRDRDGRRYAQTGLRREACTRTIAEAKKIAARRDDATGWTVQ